MLGTNDRGVSLLPPLPHTHIFKPEGISGCFFGALASVNIVSYTDGQLNVPISSASGCVRGSSFRKSENKDFIHSEDIIVEQYLHIQLF